MFLEKSKPNQLKWLTKKGSINVNIGMLILKVLYTGACVKKGTKQMFS
jgi:hypothetical protein